MHSVRKSHHFKFVQHCIFSGLACSLNLESPGHLVLTAGLHLQPLLPLFHSKGSPDVAFMQSYTTALYFVSECLLLFWLFTNSVIRYTHTTDLLMLEIYLREAI